MTNARENRAYPYEDGGVIVLGPEIFVVKDGSVICWQGTNYTPQTLPHGMTAAEGGTRQ